jgi:hypothetical protein
MRPGLAARRLRACVYLLLVATVLMSADAYAARTRRIVRYDGVATDVIVDGEGPAIVLLPSLARDSEDYDAVADGQRAR